MRRAILCLLQFFTQFCRFCKAAFLNRDKLRRSSTRTKPSDLTVSPASFAPCRKIWVRLLANLFSLTWFFLEWEDFPLGLLLASLPRPFDLLLYLLRRLMNEACSK